MKFNPTRLILIIGMAGVLMLVNTQLTQAQTLRVTTTTINGFTQTDSLYYTPDELRTHVFGNLDFSAITSGYVLDKGLRAFNPLVYDGKNGDDSVFRSTSSWFNIYSALQRGNVNAYADLKPADTLQMFANNHLKDNIVPIALVNRAYHYIRSDAVAYNCFTVSTDSTILYDNPSRTVNPFLKNRLFAGGPIIAGNNYSSNGDVKFILPAALFQTDTLNNTIQVDFGDGNGYRDINLGDPVTVTYSSSGIKNIKIQQDGMETISNFTFAKETYFQYTEDPSSGTSFSVDYAANTNLLRGVSGATWTPFLGCDNTLNKPILLVEGLNIENNPSARKIFNDTEHGTGMFSRLQALGYDICVVKFANNGASIFDNATALENVINDINSQKIGTEKLSIIALSMGGVIAKYCLKSMEDRSLTHNVQTYISYDAPHQGAYVPIGLQHLIAIQGEASDQTRDDPNYQQIIGVLKSTAAKQLLTLNWFDSNNDRYNFASAYAAQGYPTQCNNYAVTNGTVNGTGLGYADGTKMLFIQGDRWGFHHTENFWAMNPASIKVSEFLQTGLATWFIINWFTNVYNIKSTVYGYANHLYESEPGSNIPSTATYENLVGQALRSAKVPTSTNSFGRARATFIPTVSALDLNNQSMGVSGNYISQDPFFNLAGSSTPFTSLSPFADYYSTGTNLDHLTTDAGMANFIINKIYGSSPPSICTTLCSNIPSFTASTPCQNEDGTVTMANFGNGVSITWSMPSGVTLVSGQNTNAIHFVSTVSGTITIGVSLARPGCTPVAYSTTVTVIPIFTNEVSYVEISSNGLGGPDGVLCNHDHDYDDYANTFTYHLSFTPPAPLTLHYYIIDPVYGAFYQHAVTVINQSGTLSLPASLPVGAYNLELYLTTGGGYCNNTSIEYEGNLEYANCNSYAKLAVYPNPASTELTISYPVNEKNGIPNNTNTPKDFKIKLLNNKGQILKSAASGKAGSKVVLPVSDIPNGTYFLHLQQGNNLTRQQIIVQH
jgi:hypothetical protein